MIVTFPGEGWTPLAGLADLSRTQVSKHGQVSRQLRLPARCSAMCSSKSWMLSPLC